MFAEAALKAVFNSFQITPSELKVIKHLFEGLSNEQIGERLGIKEKSVKFHISSIYRKTFSGSRSEFLVKFMSQTYEAEQKLLISKYEARLFAATNEAKTRADIISAWNTLSSSNYRSFNHQNLKTLLAALDLVSN